MPRTTHDAVDEGSLEGGLTTEERFDLLADERRRRALAALAERSAPIDLEPLAEAVADRETDGTAPSADEIERVAVSLHHVHLPRAADLGVLEYDAEETRVEHVETIPTGLSN
ncbi:DUF7344 domain-containing protein [Halosimplex sp. J119]